MLNVICAFCTNFVNFVSAECQILEIQYLVSWHLAIGNWHATGYPSKTGAGITFTAAGMSLLMLT
jgi:hypothetical protein